MGRATRDTFDSIAKSWDVIRTVQKFLFVTWFDLFNSRWKKGKVLDIGCGNCKSSSNLQGFEVYGLDFSSKMIKAAARRVGHYGSKVRFIVGDASSLPVKDGSFDYAIATAVYHHIESGRLEALKELCRVLKPGGEAFVTVWYLWKDRFMYGRRDLIVPWKTGGKIHWRYYHLFSFRELRGLIRQAGFEIVLEGSEKGWGWQHKIRARNACFLVRKK